MNNELSKINLTGWVIGVSAFIVNVIIIFIIISSASDMSGETSNPVSDSEGFLMSSYTHDVGNGEKITAFSAQTYNQTWLNFDGNNNTINYTNGIQELNWTLNSTIIVRFKTLSNKTLSAANIFTNTVTGGSRSALSLNNQTITFGNYNGSRYISTERFNMVPHNQWNFVSIHTKEGNINTSYVNMSLNGDFSTHSGSSFPSTSSTQKFNIGSKNGVDSFFNGSIDYFAIFDKFLYQTDAKNIYQKNSLYSNYSLNKETLDFYMSKVHIINNTYAIGNYGIYLYRTLNGGNSWSGFNMSSGTGGGTIFSSKNGTTLITSGHNGNISISINNWTNWNEKTIFQCQNQSGIGYGTLVTRSIAEDNFGNIYIGEYSDTSGTSDGNCSYIYKSTNAGNTWTIVYNHTAEGYTGRHIHFVAVDPYTNYIYAGQGDSAYGGSRLIRSVDNGTTWTTIENISTGSISQYMDMVATPSCRYFGTDITGGDNLIRRTCNDTHLETVYTMAPDEDGYGWTMNYDDENDIIYVGTVAAGGSGASMVLVGLENGTQWYGMNYLNGVSDYNGLFLAKGFANGYTYLIDGVSHTTYKAYLYTTPNIYSPKYYWNMNENSGTTAYDSSGNGNNGTISGATWQNDGVLVSLTQDTDFSINKVSGVLTLLNPVYLFSYITTAWTESNTDDSVSMLRGNVSAGVDVISGKIPVLFLILIIGVILIVLAGLAALFYLLMKKVPGRFSGGI